MSFYRDTRGLGLLWRADTALFALSRHYVDGNLGKNDKLSPVGTPIDLCVLIRSSELLHRRCVYV